MKKILLFLCIAGSAFAISYIPSFNSNKMANSFVPDKPMNNYLAEWKKVSAAQEKGLTEDALKLVEGIYTQAKRENNTAQIVKALYHVALFNNYKEEDATNKTIARFETELKTAQMPLKPILHNIIGQLYWSYFNQQRWQIMGRSNTTNFKQEDIATYSTKDIVDVCLMHYLESVKGADTTQKIKIDFLEPVLYKGDAQSRKLRPTLFDFLAFQAATFFSSADADVTRPADQFDLNEDVYLKPYSDFIKAKIVNKDDKYALKYYALSIYQKIEQALASSTDKDALLDAQLSRLRFVYSNSVNASKEAIYMKTLKQVVEEFPTSYIASEYAYTIAAAFNQSASTYNPYGDTTARWHYKSAIEWCDFTIAKFPKTIGCKQAINLKQMILRPELNIVSEEANEPLKPFRLSVDYRNASQLYYRILKVDFDEYEKEKQNYESQAKILKYLNTRTIIRQGNQTLPLPKDFQAHRTELKFEGLPNGFYVIQTSMNKAFNAAENLVSHVAFFNSNLAYLYDNSGNGGKLIVAHRQSGEPIANAKVQIYAQIYDYTTSRYKSQLQDVRYSDKSGLVDLSGLKYDQGNFTFEIFSGEDFIYSNTSYYFNNNAEPKAYTAEVSHFFTDRGIYRPSQTVYFKAILTTKTGNNVAILAKKATTVTLFDANYQKVQDINLVSNEFGSVAGQFNIPVGLLTGNYSIGNGSGSINFSVEEYKRPTFEVRMDPLQGEFNLNDQLSFKGKAMAYNGSVISGAKVKYKVTRQSYFPFVDYYYSRCFPYYNAEPTQIAFGEVLSNDTGGFVIPFTALPDKKLSKERKPYFSYSVSVDVTDINGETRSASNSISIGYQSLLLDINANERIDKNDSARISVSAQNLNGENLDVNVKWKVVPLKHHGRLLRAKYWEKPDQFILSEKEFVTAFPNDVYKEEDDWHTWPKQAAIMEKQGATKNGSLEILFKEILTLPVGDYLIEASATDKQGEVVSATKHIAISDYNKGLLPHPDLDHFQFTPSNSEPGATISYRWLSPLPSPYLVLVERPDQPYNLAWTKTSDAFTDFKINESDRGGVYVTCHMLRLGRFYSQYNNVSVPFSNKELDIKFSTFRNKLLPGEKETWQMVIKDRNNLAANAEMLATLYDASLDAFRSNDWYFNLYDNFYKRFNLMAYYFGRKDGEQMDFIKDKNVGYEERHHDEWNNFGALNGYGRGGGYGIYPSASAPRKMRMKKKDGDVPEPAMMMSAAPEMERAESKAMDKEEAPKGVLREQDAKTENTVPPSPETKSADGGIVTRKNFNETAFFYPQLKTNDKGELVVSFTMPEALTKWKMLGLAHTKDLKFGRIQNNLVTQKDLMIQANAPRFLRENDEVYFSAKVSNLTDKALSGVATLEILDAFTMQPVSAKFELTNTNQNFNCAAKLNAALAWKLKVPEGLVQAIVYRVTAKAGNFSDGEENSLPILSDKMLITETMPLYINGKGTKTYSFAKLLDQNNHSTTLKNHAFTVEFSSNPAWYAVQALPYLMEYPHECAEQTFSRLYANALASHVVNSKPKIKQVFEAWKNYSPESFLSNLQKNEELKQVILQETPWVMQAANESDRKKNVGLLFDLNKMSNELNRAVNQLVKMQLPNGAFPWFNGMLEDRYITQLIIGGFGKLNKMGVKTYADNAQVNAMIKRAIQYCDAQIEKDFNEIKKYDKAYIKNNHNSAYIIQYLYARSFYKEVPINTNYDDAFTYFIKQCNDHWLEQSRSVQGLSALVLQRNGKQETAKMILKSLAQNALYNDEMGMYWKENYGYYWYQAPIETQALMIEAFDEVNGDIKAVNQLKQWLLKSKQTQDWKTTRATADAVYALLLKGDDWLDTEPNVEIQVGDVKLKPGKDANIKTEAGTGYFKYTFRNDEVKANMGNIKIQKSKDGISWGAVYWQYFEKLDKITNAETPLQLKKQVFIVENNKNGEQIKPVANNNELKIGDKLKVRIELRVDRDMEYVHMKDMRAAGFEPVNVLSESKYQDGLNYYESTKDAATHFFFGYLRKGVYVFEYPLFVTHNGDFSNGVTTIQCMYAPEFTSHSEGIRVKVK
jgi:uncharacterized protein YfaS (alpha-2-macroglobulin family)